MTATYGHLSADAKKSRPEIGRLTRFKRRTCYGKTRKATLLLSVPFGVVTMTVPVVAPVGTLVSIAEAVTLSNGAVVPLKATLIVPVRLFPRMITLAPTLPEVGLVSTNGPRPVARLKIVPQPNGSIPQPGPPWYV